MMMDMADDQKQLLIDGDSVKMTKCDDGQQNIDEASSIASPFICKICEARYSFSGKFETLLTDVYEKKCSSLDPVSKSKPADLGNLPSTLCDNKPGKLDKSAQNGNLSAADDAGPTQVPVSGLDQTDTEELSQGLLAKDGATGFVNDQKPKQYCSICLGVLEPEFMVQLARQAVCSLLEERFDCRQYFPTFCLPVSCLVRESFLMHQINERAKLADDAGSTVTLPTHGSQNGSDSIKSDSSAIAASAASTTTPATACYELKEASKMIIVRLLAKLLPADWKHQATIPPHILKGVEQDRVEIMFWLSHDQEDCDCAQMAKLVPNQFDASNCPRGKRAHNAKKSKPDSRTLYNRTSVKTALGRIEKSPELRRKVLEIQLEPITARCTNLIQFARPPVHMAGRYCKYNRSMFQSYWSRVDEESVGEMATVEGLIAKPCAELVRPAETTFSAAGREDFDVRMLGSGRPFVVSLHSPRIKFLTNPQLVDMQMRINSSTGDVQITHLQLVDEKDLVILKEGEESKVKHYVAQVYCDQPVIDQQLINLINRDHQINVDHPLVLQQRTPLRVLHRRPNSIRSKSIYSLRADRIDQYSFMLQLSTQAGTYVKEFVHGDLGRTRPSLRSITGLGELQIRELDVAGVDLDWPPPVKNE